VSFAAAPPSTAAAAGGGQGARHLAARAAAGVPTAAVAVLWLALRLLCLAALTMSQVYLIAENQRLRAFERAHRAEVEAAAVAAAVAPT